MLRSAAALLALLPALALGGERTLLLKTFEDTRYPPDMDFCATAGFPARIFLGAGVWSLQTNAARGEVMNDEIRFLGKATACALMTSAEPYTPTQPFVIRFELADGTYVAKGQCDIVSNDVPVPYPGLLLVGCALRVVQAPEGTTGFATSASVLDLTKGRLGFGTGSVWTLHLYTAD